MSLSFVDKMVSAYTKGETMPLKGHMKVTFADADTGKIKEVIEKDNLITNAVGRRRRRARKIVHR